VEPFIVPLAWSAVLAIFFAPLHERIEKRLKRLAPRWSVHSGNISAGGSSACRHGVHNKAGRGRDGKAQAVLTHQNSSG